MQWLCAMHMIPFKRKAVNSVSQTASLLSLLKHASLLSPLSSSSNSVSLSNLRLVRASRPCTDGVKVTGRKYSPSLKPHQRLSHPHFLFFSETPTTATCSANPIPTPPLRHQGPPILLPIFSRLQFFFSGFLPNPSVFDIILVCFV